MESKICTRSNTEKHVNKFYKTCSECKDCNIKRGVKRYYDNKGKISMQQKICYEKNRDELLQKQNYYSKKAAQIINNYIDLILNYKINQKH